MRGPDPILADWLARARNAPLVNALPAGLHQKRIGKDIACACPRQAGSKDTLAVSPAKHVWMCRRCDESSGSAIDLMIHTGGAADAFEAAERLLGEARPGRAGDPAAREQARRGAESEAAGFAAGRAGHDLHQALAGEVHDRARFEAGYASGRKARARDEALHLQEQERRERADSFYANAVQHPAAIATYFAARGIAFAPPPWMRWHAGLDYWHGGRVIHRGPAIITPLHDGRNVRCGVHATWVDMDTPPKFRPALQVEGVRLPTKKMFGTARGCAMWLTRRHRRMLIGEGLETVAATLSRVEGFGGMAAGSLAAFASLPVDCFSEVSEAVLLGDGDSDPAATTHYLQKGALRLKEAGVATVRIASAPPGKDFADLAARERVEA